MLRSKRARWALVPLLVAVIGWLWFSNLSKMWNIATLPDMQEAVAELRAERDELDQTVWADEVLAQQYEQYFIQLWDDLRATDDKHAVLERAPFDELKLGRPTTTEDHGAGVTATHYTAGGEVLGPDQWRDFLKHLKNDGYRLVQSEWHHKTFDHDVTGGARSGVDIVLHIVRDDGADRIEINGHLAVEWSREKDEHGNFRPRQIDASRITMLRRKSAPAFERAFSTERLPITGPGNWEDVLVHDLNQDGLSDIISLPNNRVYWNRGDFAFEPEDLCTRMVDHVTGGVLADFTGDGLVDLLVLRTPPEEETRSIETIVLYQGNREGRFVDMPRQALVQPLEFKSPDSCAVGDVDRDGDLDLWVTQYKKPYMGGQMPTPYYDANDGWPSYLLLGDGKGRFVDATEAAGLAAKRHRRTYRSSLVDLDDDGDLDLIVVSDFAGIDVHLNDGRGHFVDATASMVDEPSTFGMSHTFADFNTDGRLDLYVAGMSSTTAARLDQMGLGRNGFADYQKMRTVIAYGNRMYLRTKTDLFAQPDFRDQIARCGWSWGTGSLDFDSDGDPDIYVANGHNSGDSAKDYCTKFWRHDIYTGSSTEQPVIDVLFVEDLIDKFYTDDRGVRRHESWNGYEHNRLLMNQSGEGFLNVAFLMGVAMEADSRHVVVDDFNLDGKPDLLVGWMDRNPAPTQLVVSIFQNKWPEANHWIGVRAHGAPGVSPLGAKVTVAYADGRQVAAFVAGDSFAAQHANLKHFGLGKRDKVDYLTIRWPNGQETRIDQPKIDRYHDLHPPTN